MTLSTSSSRAVRTRTGILAPAARRRRRTSKPSMPGQAHVEDDEVGRLARRDLEALLAGAGDRDLVALLLEGVLDAAGDRVLVFDDEDGGCHAAMLHRRATERSRRRRRATRGILRTLRAPRQLRPRRRAAALTYDNTRSRGSASMPTARATLAAEHREHHRQEGRPPPPCRPPAGRRLRPRRVDSTNISVDAHEFEQLRRHSGPNALVDLSIDGGEGRAGPRVGVQVHPVNRRTAPRRTCSSSA